MIILYNNDFEKSICTIGDKVICLIIKYPKNRIDTKIKIISLLFFVIFLLFFIKRKYNGTPKITIGHNA